jgi:hypothetical protein
MQVEVPEYDMSALAAHPDQLKTELGKMVGCLK